MKLSKEQVLGILRHTLTFAGGIGITLGYLDPSVVTEIISITMTLIGVIWSVIKNKKDAPTTT